MFKREYWVIGVMSGTSLDGIDAVYAKLMIDSQWTFKILKSKTYPYDDEWVNLLNGLVQLSEENLKAIDVKYTTYLSTVINQFISENNIIRIDAVCSHGHTALHQPDKGYTLQIGNLPSLATLTNQLIVCDFRVQDVELGGQGAPLVPIGDQLLFHDYDICLNLGGFANLSVESKGERIAFDVCPVNIVLNKIVKPLGLSYDDEGKIASKGQIDNTLLEDLNTLEFYNRPYPKSLGLEWVKKEFFPIVENCEDSIPNVLRSCVEHMAGQIANVLNSFSGNKVIITGGGAYNKFLIKRISEKCDKKLIVPNEDIVEFKEALIFGLLGVLKLRDEVNCLRSVTGASHNHSSGKIFHP